MKSPEVLQQVYEDLADRYAQLGEARRRDHCLVLAADAALSAGHPDEAERLRQCLLRINPHHLLRPYASMGEAVQSNDVQDYIADLRQQMPPDMVEQLLADQPPPAEPVYKLVHEKRPPTPLEMSPMPPEPPPPTRTSPRTAVPAAPRAPVPPPPPPPRKAVPLPKAPAPTRQTASPTAPVAVPHVPATDQPSMAGRWAASFLLLIALGLGGGAVFFAFIRPFFEP
jgi:hypothetical protein